MARLQVSSDWVNDFGTTKEKLHLAITGMFLQAARTIEDENITLPITGSIETITDLSDHQLRLTLEWES